MDLNPQPLSTRLKVASVVIAMMLFLLLAPAKWFGIGKETYQKNETLPTLDQLTVSSINADNDNDGIPNWKESLLGTNPNTKNSAPSVNTSASNKTAAITPEDRQADTRLNDPKNLTSQYIKNTVGLSTYLNDQGVTDEATLSKVSSNIIDETKKLDEVKIYTQADLTVSNDEKLATIKTYGNTLGKILSDMYITLDVNTILNPLQDYTNTKDPKKLQEYKPKADLLNTTIKKLVALSVPSSAVEAHLYFINALEAYEVTLLDLAGAEQDPMRGMIAISGYKNSYSGFINSIFGLASYFSNKTVVFIPQESGFIFTRLILAK